MRRRSRGRLYKTGPEKLKSYAVVFNSAIKSEHFSTIFCAAIHGVAVKRDDVGHVVTQVRSFENERASVRPMSQKDVKAQILPLGEVVQSRVSYRLNITTYDNDAALLRAQHGKTSAYLSLQSLRPLGGQYVAYFSH
jgi:hypothetical protein